LTNEYKVLKSKIDKTNERPDTDGIRIYMSDDFETRVKYDVQIGLLELKINTYIKNFEKDELEKIKTFFSEYINEDEIKFTKLIDSIGCENLNSLCNEIDNLELQYLKGKIDLNSIRNIKLLILKEKKLINSVI
jgi:DNA polymerase III delta subunit